MPTVGAKQPAILTIVLLLSSAAFSQTIALSPNVGPPTATTEVSGSGFLPNQSINLSFDSTNEAIAISDSTGAFSKVAIVPASALPGSHTVSAVQSSNHTAQATFTVNTNWSVPGFSPQRTGFNPYENVLNPGNVGGLQLKWVFDSGGFSVSWPVEANGVVYFCEQTSGVYALDAITGAVLWRQGTCNSRMPPVFNNGVLYVSQQIENGLQALDARTGAPLWTYMTDGGVYEGAPVVANGVVYVTSSSYTIYAINARTGAKLWSVLNDFVDSSTTPVANGILYVTTGYNESNVVAMDAATGASLWSVRIPWDPLESTCRHASLSIL